MLIQRALAPVIQDISAQFPVLLLTGPRQVGKTTLLEMCAKTDRRYVTLDDLNSRHLAQQDPKLFIQTFKPPVTIDEIQHAPRLFSSIKIAVDSEKQKPGMYWLTGSQKFNLMRGITESLAGRVAIVDLLGLSLSEIKGSNKFIPFLPTDKWLSLARKQVKKPENIHSIYQHIWQGSFPKVAKMSARQRNIYYRSYVQTYIQRDIRDITGISNETIFYNFITAVAARTGQLLNYSDLARDVAIDNKTAKLWLSVLKTSGLVYLLQPWYRNITKRLIKTPKLYFLDTGLASYLTQWTNSKSLSAGAMSGSMLETWLFSELLKSYWHTGQPAHFYYYRDMDQREVDLLIETGEQFYPVEFKKTATPDKNAIKHFSLLKKLEKPVGPGAVFCLIEKDIPLSETVRAIPASYL